MKPTRPSTTKTTPTTTTTTTTLRPPPKHPKNIQPIHTPSSSPSAFPINTVLTSAEVFDLNYELVATSAPPTFSLPFLGAQRPTKAPIRLEQMQLLPIRWPFGGGNRETTTTAKPALSFWDRWSPNRPTSASGSTFDSHISHTHYNLTVRTTTTTTTSTTTPRPITTTTTVPPPRLASSVPVNILEDTWLLDVLHEARQTSTTTTTSRPLLPPPAPPSSFSSRPSGIGVNNNGDGFVWVYQPPRYTVYNFG